MARLSIALLGSFEVRLEGEPVTAFDSNKVRALLAYLAVNAERRHSRESLAGLLWPDLPDRVAHTNLRNALANLRKAIRDREVTPPHLFSTRETIQFSTASDCWLDVAAFRAAAAPAIDRRGQDGRTEVLYALENALSLYRGPFLENLPVGNSSAWEEWCLQVREQLEREALGALERLAAAYEVRGELDSALGLARRQVEWAPWREEEGHRRLMRLLALSGQRSAALAQFEACRRALRNELDVEPDPETVRLYEQIRCGDAPETRPLSAVSNATTGSPSMVQGNLPAALTPFVGRERELADLGRLLADATVRLLTVVGPGGCGKTRLALEAATAETNQYSHGVWLVSLASLQAAEGIVPAVAQALGFSFGDGAAPCRQLLDYLRRKQMLLLLDNCEHLLAGGELWAEVLQAAPGVRLLTTSRVRLGLQGETVFELAGLACPPEEETALEPLSAYSAVALFLSMAQRVRPGWAPRGEEWAHVAQLCRQVQGMPLALLLAAAWMDTLSPADIAQRVAEDLGFLETEWRDVPERQRSMRAVFDASWQLLTAREQAVFAATAVFHGGFMAQAAQAVASADERTLRSLVHKSFLQVERAPTSGRAARYGMHELLRQYALERLDQSPDGGRGARERHAAYCLAAAERWAEELKGPRQRAALAEMEAELGNLRAAWEWAVEQGHWAQVEQAAEGLALFYDWRGHGEEAHLLFGQAADQLCALIAGQAAVGPELIRALVELLAWEAYLYPDDRTQPLLAQCCRELLARSELAGQDVRRQRALVLRVSARHLAGSEQARAGALLEESLALYRALGDRWAEAVVLGVLAYVEYIGGQVDDARRQWEESLALFRALGEQQGIAGCLYRLHHAYAWQGRFAEAERVVEERMALAREWGDLASLTQAYEMLASIRYLAGRPVEAVELLEREYMPHVEELGDRVQWGYCNAWLGHFKLDSGDYGSARAHAERSLALGRELNNWRVSCAALPVLAMQALLEARYEEASRLYQETLAMAEEAGYRILWTYYGGEWAAAELWLGRRDAAQRCLRSALQAAAGQQSSTLPIRVLPAIALWLAAQGQAEQAVEVYALAQRYPHIANSRWYQDVFGPTLTVAAASLAPEVVQAAQARGQARELGQTVQELLAELGV